MSILLAALLGYLLGAIPFGLIIGRLTRGIDIREYGSHRTGATNALRTLGTRAAVAVFVLDVAKGVAAVLVARTLFSRRLSVITGRSSSASPAGAGWRHPRGHSRR
jgi:acyl phosphate:glycerol-3-phosphate acyltransferase